MADFIPVNQPLLDGNESTYLSQCAETGWISSEGGFVRQLEEGFAAFVGRAHGVAVMNGTVALDAAVHGLGIGPGDEVIIPDHTIISCAAAVVRAGATPVVIDADPLTWCMDVARVAEAVTPRTRAIMPVHIFGLPVDMDPLLALAREHGLAVIEDAAQAHGLLYKGRMCGSFGDISTFSFYPNKLITTGEGGMVLTDDDGLAQRVRSARNLYFTSERRFVHEELGWNWRMSNVQAALGVAQLERIESFRQRKRKAGLRYLELLENLPGLTLPKPDVAYADNLFWVFGVVLDDEVDFDAREAMKRLGEKGIGTRPFFWPMHEQPVFVRDGLFQGVSCPVSSRIARRGFYLPSGLGLTDAQQDQVAWAVREVMGG